jgi:hypothetical protein
MTDEQRQHIDAIVASFDREVRAKYEAGQREHGGNIWTKPGMLRHAKEEVLDLWVYLETLERQLREKGITL